MANKISYKVLVVDDEPSVSDLLRDLLKKENHLVQCVASGEEALDRISGEDFDVVLLDIKLSGMSGLETLKKIKEVKPNVVVIMTTGFGYNEDLIDKSGKLGSSGYIGKNMPIPEIMDNFRMFVEKAKGEKG
jgi:DNA-binding response OmpR family regulator